MKNIIRKMILILSTIFIFLISSLIYTLLLYHNKTNTSAESIYQVTTIIGVIIFFLFGIFNGIFSSKKAFFSTFLIVLGSLVILFIIKKLSNDNFNNKVIIKYLLYLASSLLGTIFSSIFKKKVNN